MRCSDKERFKNFAILVGLTRYPRPDGERYIYKIDGTCDGKKSECTDFIDELWNALVRAMGNDKLLIPTR